jgi:hypothetical protein
MTEQQLEQLKKWFYGYVATFYGSDALSDENIRLKEEHTRRMCADTPKLAEQLGLNQRQKLIAETISLLHDVGRFEQFKKYRTYNDVGTENHSLLGLKVIAENKILDGLAGSEKEIIETAIKFHGEKDLPKGLEGETEFFAKLIRDIDKLDIYYVMIERLEDFQKNPDKAQATLGFSEKDKYSKDVVEAVLKNQTIGYDKLKSLNDMVIAMLGWIFDINFAATMKEMKKRGLFDKLAGFLPDKDDIRAVVRHINHYLDKKISGD